MEIRKNGVEKLRNTLDQAETVLAGAGAELSTSAGFVYTCERLERYFGDFVKKYQNQYKCKYPFHIILSDHFFLGGVQNFL